MNIKINCDSSKIDGVMKVLNDGFKNFQPLLKDISTLQLQSADEAFKTRGSNIGQPWAPLKVATVKQKIRIGKNIDILQRTGKMRQSFLVSKLTGNELEIANSISYFKYHQTGTSKMPQRQMLGHSSELIKRYQIAMNQYVLKLIQTGMK